MADSRTSSHRFRLVALLAIVMVLALGSFWALDIVQRGLDESMPAAKRTEPDYYVEQFRYIKLAQSGQARYHVSGTRLTHYPQDDSHEIQQPVIKSVRLNEPPTTIRAERALTDADTSRVQLFDKVQMVRAPSADTQQLTMRSEYLLVLPDDDLVKTDRPVEIRLGDSVLQGVGMVANQATREFKLSSQVRGMIPPKIPN